MPRETDASLRRRLRRELARAAKLDLAIADKSQRSFHRFVAKKMQFAPGVKPPRTAIGEWWAWVTGRR